MAEMHHQTAIYLFFRSLRQKSPSVLPSVAGIQEGWQLATTVLYGKFETRLKISCNESYPTVRYLSLLVFFLRSA
jgi:hypothetical protein